LVDFYTKNNVPAENIRVKISDGGHNFPTDKVGLNDCENQSVPYLSSCQYDLAKDLLQHLLGRQLVKSVKPNASQNLYRVDQNLIPQNVGLIEKNWKAPVRSLGAYGYLYASEKCLNKPSACDMHVALHGCEMSDSFDANFDKIYANQVMQTLYLGMRTQSQRGSLPKQAFPVIEDRVPKMGTLQFALQSGYIELADKNDLMILFPQTWITEHNYPYNPKGCWDWFGFTGRDYATKRGAEMSWLSQYIKQIQLNPKKYLLPKKPN
jgi:hypothetical protein